MCKFNFESLIFFVVTLRCSTESWSKTVREMVCDYFWWVYGPEALYKIGFCLVEEFVVQVLYC